MMLHKKQSGRGEPSYIRCRNHLNKWTSNRLSQENQETITKRQPFGTSPAGLSESRDEPKSHIKSVRESSTEGTKT